jgi:selenium metabolism protein YedF
MAEIVDARGLACPQPVVLARKAMQQHAEFVVLVDDTVARENVKKLAAAQGYTCTEESSGNETRITMTRGDACAAGVSEALRGGPVVVAISSAVMGSGDDTLGGVLMKSFLHTLTEAGQVPDTLLLFNSGVKLAVQGSEVLDDLKTLAEAGVDILSCGTCLNFFEIKDRLAVGEVTNMYDIVGAMLGAAKVIRI